VRPSEANNAPNVSDIEKPSIDACMSSVCHGEWHLWSISGLIESFRVVKVQKLHKPDTHYRPMLTKRDSKKTNDIEGAETNNRRRDVCDASIIIGPL